MRNILVSGATRGLGLGVARKLASDGFQVIAIGRKPTDELSAAIEEARCGAIAFRPFDLMETERIPSFIRDLKGEFGPFYGLVNNAGLGAEGLLATMSAGRIEAVIRLNTLAPILLSKSVVRSMLSEGSGRIVNMASIIAFTGYNGLSVYAATKASMIGFTRSLAREVGRAGITVNAIAPGFIDTDMTQGMPAEQRERVARRSALRRLAEVEDVANSASFLISDAARNITGTVLTVDAGSTA